MNYYEVMVSRQRNQLHADLIKAKKREAIQMVIVAALSVVLVAVLVTLT